MLFTAESATTENQESRGFVPLNFYNLFWIFVIGSIIGICVETLYQIIVFDRYEVRAGLVWGPFSPIYGLGGVLFTVALNRFWDKNVIVIFLTAVLLGTSLEFCSSLIMESCFGLVAWDYSGTFGSIQGRTNFAFGLMWGVLGLLWVRLALPLVLKLIDLIPWRYHIAITIGLAAFMAFNILVTITAIDRQYQRLNGIPATNLVQGLCDEHFPDDWIKERFPNIRIDASLSGRS